MIKDCCILDLESCKVHTVTALHTLHDGEVEQYVYKVSNVTGLWPAVMLEPYEEPKAEPVLDWQVTVEVTAVPTNGDYSQKLAARQVSTVRANDLRQMDRIIGDIAKRRIQ
jgi:hypothetical protein